MLSLPPAGGTGKKINGASLFGKDRYAQYVHEMNAHGTIEGIPLSKKERIEGFKSRDKKINFEKFVGKVLSEKSVGVSSDGVPTPSLGPKLSMAKSENFTSQPFTAPDIPEPETQTESQDTAKKEDFEGVGDKIDELIDEIKTGNKGEKKENERKRKRAEDKRRKSKEDRFESLKKFVAKPIEKVLAPIQNVFKKILDGLMTILFAKALLKLIDWFSDPDNQKKVQAITKFISQFWPAIVAGFIAISVALNPFVTWVITTGAKLVVGLVKMTGKLIAASARLAASGIGKLKKLALKNPKAALATALVVGTGALAVAGSRMEASEDPGPGITPNEVKSENNTDQAGMEQKIGFESGGKVPKKGTDTVPAMLTPGEFVMSKGAVEKFGAATLASMNAMGGGTNRPKILDGTTYAQGGGEVHPLLQKMSDKNIKKVGSKKGQCVRGSLLTMEASGVPQPWNVLEDPGNHPRGAMVQMIKDNGWKSMGGTPITLESPYGTVDAGYYTAGEYESMVNSGKIPSGAVVFQTKHDSWNGTSPGSSGYDMAITQNGGKTLWNGVTIPSPLVYGSTKQIIVLTPDGKGAPRPTTSSGKFADFREGVGEMRDLQRQNSDPDAPTIPLTGANKAQLGATRQKGSSMAGALSKSAAISQAGRPGMQVLPQVGGAAAPRPSSGGSGVPNLGSVDPNNNTLIVMKSIYNLA